MSVQEPRKPEIETRLKWFLAALAVWMGIVFIRLAYVQVLSEDGVRGKIIRRR